MAFRIPCEALADVFLAARPSPIFHPLSTRAANASSRLLAALYALNYARKDVAAAANNTKFKGSENGDSGRLDEVPFRDRAGRRLYGRGSARVRADPEHGGNRLLPGPPP